MRDRKKKKKQR